ncbi:hypothetical protein GCM10025867_19010 [Frondihabitans sucicola]|uniref:DUF4245 domain-containing protein n=1 Tax=Frondihabitans sucicola TaxID=1268041 RepID=A0ABM8GMK9_9MICO|nr:DUF4245 family protein [Frondihabitans sucicola]BDZ49660.1 hypothetical protein GCM10025867_19010 [Frondihabitans sucicola]
MTNTPSSPPPSLGKQRAPRVVAELGRPETPGETAARKAASSRAHRENQTAFNLVIAIVVSVVIVVLLVLAVVRPNGSQLKSVDYLQVASQAQQQVTTSLVAPKMPSGWTSNRAEIKPAGSDGVQSWYIGFLTPKTQFIGMTQGFKANKTWVSNQLDEGNTTSSTRIDGVTWNIYDRRSDDGAGNLEYAMVTTVDDSTVVLAGTADDAEFTLLAKRATAQLEK